MQYDLLGWPPDGPKLRLDHERFSYAGKFVMTNTGKAVARDADGTVVAAVAFNEDRTDESTLWLRYVTVDRDRRGEGIGPELLGRVRDRAIARGYDRLRIAVNNPFAYEALYRTGFAYTGETTGIAELVLEFPAPLDGGDADTGVAAETAGDGNGDANSDSDANSDGDDNRGDSSGDGDADDGGRSRRERYQAGLEEFRDRDLSDDEERFLDSRRDADPPASSSV